MGFLGFLLMNFVVVLMGWAIDASVSKWWFGPLESRADYRDTKSFKDAFTK